MKKNKINGKLIDKDEIEEITEKLVAKEREKKILKQKRKIKSE